MEATDDRHETLPIEPFPPMINTLEIRGAGINALVLPDPVPWELCAARAREAKSAGVDVPCDNDGVHRFQAREQRINASLTFQI